MNKEIPVLKRDGEITITNTSWGMSNMLLKKAMN